MEGLWGTAWTPEWGVLLPRPGGTGLRNGISSGRPGAAAHAPEGVDIWTGDKDLLQCCARDGVRVLDAKGVSVDAAAKFGVLPSQVGDYLALVGDASDNIAGVAGVGPKAAKALLDAHGDLETALADFADGPAPKRARDALAKADPAAVRRDRKLVGLEEAVPLPPLECAPFDWDALLAFADELGFADFKKKVIRRRGKEQKLTG